MFRSHASIALLVCACFDPGAGNTGGDGTTDGGTEGTTDASMSMSGASMSSSDTASTTTPPTTGSESTASAETSPPGECGSGEVCLEVPNGWMGPYSPEAGLDVQCDDASLASHFAGTEAAFDSDCSCDCGSATHVDCIGEWYGGGLANSCDDNDELLGTCTVDPAGGAVCDVGSDGCYVTDESTSFESYTTCTAGVPGTVTPGFTAGYRLCDPDTAVGSPCNGGVCTDEAGALCIVALADADACPTDFPERVDGHQTVSEDPIDCGACDCIDADDCAYQTWYEVGCGTNGGDDDPLCAPVGGVRFLTTGDASVNCAQSPDLENPDLPVNDPITLCCNTAI